MNWLGVWVLSMVMLPTGVWGFSKSTRAGIDLLCIALTWVTILMSIVTGLWCF